MPLPKDEFERRLDASFSFLGDLLQHPEKIDNLSSAVTFVIGESAFNGGLVIHFNTDISSQTNVPGEVLVLAKR